MDAESPYDPVQLKITLPRHEKDEFYLMVSRKWPVYDHGCISLEARLALKMWMQNEGSNTRTHKTTVLMETESKPNWHTRKRGIEIETNVGVPEQVPNANTNAIVLTNNSNSSGGHWLFDLASGLGVVLTDGHREMAKRMRNDSEFRKQKYEKYEIKLIGKLARSASKDLCNKVSERNNNNAQHMRQIKLYLNSKGQIDNQGRVAEKYLRNAISIVYKRSTEKRAIDRHIQELENDKEITRIGIDFSAGDRTIKGRGYLINSYEVLK
jgi:hypothetical protein